MMPSIFVLKSKPTQSMHYISGDTFLKNMAEPEETLKLSDAGELKYYSIDEAEKMAGALLTSK
jgi:hypothetical protein